MLAYSLNVDEQYEEAIECYKTAIDAFERLGERRLAARMSIGFVAALANAGRYSEALEVGDRAGSWFSMNRDEDGRARLLNSLGIVYARLDDYAKAIDCYTDAAELFERLGDREMLVRIYQNLANILGNTDQFERADELFQRAERYCEELNLSPLLVQVTYNHAYLHFLRGRFSDALQSFGRLRMRDDFSGSPRYRALCDLDEAEIYLQLSLSKDAAVLASRAIDEFKELGMPYEQARATAFYGLALTQMRRFAEALDAFHDAQAIFAAAGNAYWIGLLDLYRAEVHLSLQRLWEAQALATQAKLTFEQLAIPSKRVFSLVLLGRVALELNDLDAATAATSQIARLIQSIQVPLVLFPYHVLCGEIAERGRRWDEAQRHYELAARELERHQARLHHDDLRVTFFKGRQHAFDALVRLSLDHLPPDEAIPSAYSWCERARSRGLVELLSHYAPVVHGHAEQSLLAKINRLREELNIQYARSQPQKQPLSSQASYESIALKEQELARTLREVSGVDPEYASLQQVSIVTIESLQSVLPERTTVIEYFTAGDEILAFVLSRQGAAVTRRLCPASRILNVQERLKFQLEKFLLGRDYIHLHAAQILESTRRRLEELHRYLLAPFINEVRTPHITIVPHGTLHFLPFHAFFDGEKYLIDQYDISYAPSASVLKYCLEKPAVSEGSPLLIGVADASAPLVHQEIARLNELFPAARVLQDDAATRAAFVENAETASFVHIATHAIFRQDNPMFSSFKLADGWLTAFDLFSMACHANLVTLSGCQSGLSEVTGSDDLLGLMRGFLYAGARSLLLSLWNVDDESTAALMVRFYQEWAKGASKSAALRNAMMGLREDHPNPFYWAPFLLVANP